MTYVRVGTVIYSLVALPLQLTLTSNYDDSSTFLIIRIV